MNKRKLWGMIYVGSYLGMCVIVSLEVGLFSLPAIVAWVFSTVLMFTYYKIYIENGK